MKLFRIKTKIVVFLGNNNDNEVDAILGYVLAKNSEEVYEHINEKYKSNDWPELTQMTREAIIEAKGNYRSELVLSRLYDQKFGWEDLGKVSSEDIARLRLLRVL